MEKEDIMRGISAMIDHTVETTGLSYDHISALIVNALNLACSYAPAIVDRAVAEKESVETIPWVEEEQDHEALEHRAGRKAHAGGGPVRRAVAPSDRADRLHVRF